jgi:Zn-dependent M28 family amino/carboxypeptidase
VYPLAKTVGVINMDALSGYGPAKDFTISGSARLDLQDLLVAKAKAHGRYFTPDPSPEAGHFFRSDHFPFAKRGVPAISFGSGRGLGAGRQGSRRKGRGRYTANRYHQPADEWSADWDLSGQAMDIGLFYEVGAIWPIRRPGRNGRRARSSRRCATPPKPTGSKYRSGCGWGHAQARVPDRIRGANAFL